MPNKPTTHYQTQKKERDKLYQQANRDNFYTSQAWIRLKKAYRTDNPLCELCQLKGQVSATEHVHHKIERTVRPDLELQWNNLQSLCASCHSRTHSNTNNFNRG